MKKSIELIKSNPFRSFDLDPIKDERVNELIESVEKNGMWSGLPARKVPDTKPVEYEIACGHHRLEAAKRLGIEKIDLAVFDLTDDDMISIMINENLLQRGNENFGAVLDGVAAVIVQVVRECRGEISQPGVDSQTLAGHVRAGQGIGVKTVTDKHPTITAWQAREAIKILKATGQYANLIEKGGAPPEVVQIYRQQEEQANKNIATAMAYLKKPYQAKAFIEITEDILEASDRSKQEYIDCVHYMITKEAESKDALTTRKVKEWACEFFGIGMEVIDNEDHRSELQKLEEKVFDLGGKLSKAIDAWQKEVRKIGSCTMYCDHDDWTRILEDEIKNIRGFADSVNQELNTIEVN